ncbi:hypothetical protein [Roseivirga pacifica]|uniref:hypothetical protein n=1 Tax=Roseivirga pacifica TaxID=1267423 RepID=UPI003BAA11EE
MTIDQRKISLINWITNLKDEGLIKQVEKFRDDSLSQLPDEIVELLKKSDAESLENCHEHTSAREILKK